MTRLWVVVDILILIEVDRVSRCVDCRSFEGRAQPDQVYSKCEVVPARGLRCGWMTFVSQSFAAAEVKDSEEGGGREEARNMRVPSRNDAATFFAAWRELM